MVEHEVVNLVDAEEIPAPCSGCRDPHLVVEKPMAAHRLDPGLALRADQVQPPLFAQSNPGTI